MSGVSQEERGRRFAALHEEGCFLIPNPWDAGTARVLESLGFEALATTSSAFAFTLGRDDGEVTLDEVVGHVAALAAASDLPISVDLENGYGAAPEHAARAIEAVAAVGAVGGSIEDWDEEHGIYAIDAAAERIAAAAAVARELPFPFMLTGRAENHIRGNPDLDDTIARLRAYEAAGADVLYAPGLADIEEIAAVCAAVERPVNVLARPTLSVAGIAHRNERTLDYLRVASDEHPLAIQIFGSDPGAMAEAARMVEAVGADIVDINFGCPVKKVTKTGAGCSLLDDPDQAVRIVAAVAEATPLPVSVKMRRGTENGSRVCLDVGPRLVEAGAASLTLPDFARTSSWPICETSNRPAAARVCRCSFKTPAANCTGIA